MSRVIFKYYTTHWKIYTSDETQTFAETDSLKKKKKKGKKKTTKNSTQLMTESSLLRLQYKAYIQPLIE